MTDRAGARATDNCTDSLLLVWSSNVSAQTWSGTPGNNQITITWTVTDDCGNSAQTTATFSIADDVPPTITCPPSVTEDAAPNNCSKIPVPLPDPVYDDACSTPVLTYRMTGATTGTGNGSVTGFSFNVGVTTVTYIVTDGAGLKDSCSFTVTIVDVTPPNIEIAGCQDVTETFGPNECTVIPTTINDPDYSDDCWPFNTLVLTYTITGATTGSGTGSVAGLTFNVGISTVEYTVTDPDGNTATCSFTVTILRANIPPAVITCPNSPASVSALAGICEAPVSLDAPTIDDPCATATYTIVNDSPYRTSDTDASGNYPVGITTVTWTITDNSGNVETCVQTVEVTDDELPTITCPPDAVDQIINGGCDLVSDQVGRPTFDDNCGIESLTYVLTGATTGSSPATGINYADGETYNVGVTTVTYTVTDIHGNVNSCSHTVWIKNLNAPQFSATCPADVTSTADAGVCEAVLAPPVPVINNPCNEAYTVTNDWPDAIDSMNVNGTYPVGVTVIHWVITDASGNVTICDQTITVTDDELPTITCPPDAVDEIINGGCDLVSDQVGRPTFDDNCDIESLAYVLTGATTGSSPATGINYADGETYNVGVTTVTYTVTDIHGNVNSCSHTVWIKNLNAPQFTVTCPANVTASADPGVCEAVLAPPVPVINNPCNEAYTVTNDWPDAIDSMNVNGTYPVGVTVIHWVITDASGNVTLCDQTITVTDDELPTITCPPDAVDQIINGGCDLVSDQVGRPTFDDNCGIESLTYVLSGATTGSSPATGINYADGETYNVGVTTVTYTVTDIHGNVNSCSHTVWIKNLNAPQFSATCPADVTSTADAGVCEAVLAPPVPVINNPCNEAYTVTNDWPDAIDSMNVNGTYPVGVTVIHWVITDASGNVTDMRPDDNGNRR